MGAYKRNGDGDRGTMLRLLDGGIVSLERVGGSVFAESALMGLIATTQPDKMRMLARDLGTDGMLQRLVFVVDDGVERTPLDAPSDGARSSNTSKQSGACSRSTRPTARWCASRLMHGTSCLALGRR